MKLAPLFILLGIPVVMPGMVYADVYVSEIAWMGTLEDANAEWIELYNTGESIDLTGWTLAASDGQPSIALAGSIPGGGFFLLERTDDDTVPHVSADQLYTGAMGNAGEVLTLTNAAGVEVDRVDGAGEWAIGGDNTTKYTLQKQGGSWITAEGTPRSPNATENTPPPLSSGTPASEDTRDTTSPTTRTSTTRTASAPQPAPVLQPGLTLDIGTERSVVAGVPHTFEAITRNESGKVLSLDTVTWNFGDGAVGEGSHPRHTYEYPGTYVVRAKAARTPFRDPIRAEAELVVHVVSMALAITHVDSNSIEVANQGGEDVNLSRFALVSGKQYFRIPNDTVLLAGSSIRFSSSITTLTQATPENVGLFTPDNTLAGTFQPDTFTQEDTILVQEYATPTTSIPSPMVEGYNDVLPSTDTIDHTSATVPSANTLLPAAVAFGADTQQGTPASTPWMWWLAGLVGMVALTATAFTLARREQEEIIEGYVIESDDEGSNV